jgi:hypothetical protein
MFRASRCRQRPSVVRAGHLGLLPKVAAVGLGVGLVQLWSGPGSGDLGDHAGVRLGALSAICQHAPHSARHNASSTPALSVSPDGVDLDVRFTDVADRPVQVRIDDRNGRPRHRATLLAPVGSVIEDPAWLSLFVMGAATWCAGPAAPSTCALTAVRSRPAGCPSAGCTGAGWSSTPPTPRWSSATRLTTARWPPSIPRHPATSRSIRGRAGSRPSGLAIGGHRARLELAPALHVAHLRPRQAIEGTWQLGIDSDPAVVGGFWTAERRQDVVELVLDVVRGWRPTGLPPLMAVVTRLAPVFRTWPTTYRWRGTVTLGNQPTLAARWERKGDQRDESYRRLTNSHAR